jgi:hypothetical protein
LTIEEVAALPGFTVAVTEGPRFVPGLKSRRPGPWLGWPGGAAPPACYESAGGAGGYFDRLTTAMAKLVESLPNNTGPYIVHDFVSGRRIEVHYEPPPVGPDGEGVVYILDDGYGLKVGHTTNTHISRIRGLQTGNPRMLRPVATIAAAAPTVEAPRETRPVAHPWRMVPPRRDPRRSVECRRLDHLPALHSPAGRVGN